MLHFGKMWLTLFLHLRTERWYWSKITDTERFRCWALLESHCTTMPMIINQRVINQSINSMLQYLDYKHSKGRQQEKSMLSYYIIWKLTILRFYQKKKLHDRVTYILRQSLFIIRSLIWNAYDGKLPYDEKSIDLVTMNPKHLYVDIPYKRFIKFW